MNQIKCTCGRLVDEIAYCDGCQAEICDKCGTETCDKDYCSKCFDELVALKQLGLGWRQGSASSEVWQAFLDSSRPTVKLERPKLGIWQRFKNFFWLF